MTKPQATKMTAPTAAAPTATKPAAGKRTAPTLPSHVFVADAEFTAHGGMVYDFEDRAFTTSDGLVASVREQLSRLLVEMTVENVDDYIGGLEEFLAVLVTDKDPDDVYKTFSQKLTLVNPGRSRAVKAPFRLNIRYLKLH